MILVTLGTQKQDFKRVLDAIENSSINDEIIVQAGHTKYESKKMKIFDFISYDEMEKLVDRADYIITHGGTGSIVEPLKKGKKIIACARMQKYGEHVDNHQEELVSIFTDQGYILELKDGENLDEVMEKAKSFEPKKYESNTKSFITKLKNKIDEKPRQSKNAFIIGLIMLLLFYIISLITPIGGDDWGGKLYKTNNIIENAKLAFSRYQTQGGRIVANTLVVFFINTEWLWNIINAIMISAMYYIICKITGAINRKIIPFIIALSIIFVESTIFTQCYLWIAGNCTYTMPTFLSLLYFCLMNKIWKEDLYQNKFVIISCLVINFFGSLMAESITASLVFANVLFLIYIFIKHKKISKKVLVYFILSLVGFLIMMLSPGAAERLSTQDAEYLELSLIGKCLYNFHNFVKYTYMDNNVLMLLLTVCLCILINRNIKNKFVKVGLNLFLLLPILTTFANLLTSIKINSSKLQYILNCLKWTQNDTNILIQVYWLAFTLLLLYMTFRYVKNRDKALFYLLVGLSSNLALLLSPISGARTALYTVYMLYVFVFIIFNEIEVNRIISKYETIISLAIKLVFTGAVILVLVVYYNVYLMQIDREKVINKGIEENSEEIILLLFPNEILHNLNAWNELHLTQMKAYYGIDEEVRIKRVWTNWWHSIIYLGED